MTDGATEARLRDVCKSDTPAELHPPRTSVSKKRERILMSESHVTAPLTVKVQISRPNSRGAKTELRKITRDKAPRVGRPSKNDLRSGAGLLRDLEIPFCHHFPTFGRLIHRQNFGEHKMFTVTETPDHLDCAVRKNLDIRHAIHRAFLAAESI